MSYSPIIQNIIQPLLSLSSKDTKNINVLYDYRNSVFDKFISKYLEMSLIHKDTYPVTREILSYDIYWDNNPVEYITNINSYKNQHMLDIVFFHEYPEAVLKKEDKFLLQNRLQDSLVIYTNKLFKQEWAIYDGKYIPYGIPDVKVDLERPRKSIVLMNIDNGSRSGELLYAHIKHQFPDATMIQSISDMSYDNITDILSQHTVCITLKKSFDSLVALSCGCDVLSSSLLSEDGIVYIEDFNKINLMIDSALKNRNTKIVEERISNLIKKYDLEIFQNEIYNTIRNRMRKPFIL
jgi:hypothetical protein